MFIIYLRNINYIFSIFFISIFQPFYANIISTQPADTIDSIEPKTLLIGTDLTYAPYNYLDNGEARGFDPELMRIIGNKIGFDVKFKDTRIENIIIGLNAKHYDIVASALYVNPKRAEQVDFLPYLQTGGVLVVRKDNPFQPKILHDLCGKKISSMKGASWISNLNDISESHCIPNNFGAIEIREFPSAPEAAQALLSGGVDVQYEDAAVAKMVINRLGDKLNISSEEMIDPVVIGLAFNKSNEKLKEQIEKIFNDLRISGEYDSLLNKYNLKYPNEELIKKNTTSITDETNSSGSKFNWTYLGGLLVKKEFYKAGLTVISLSTLTWLFSVLFGFLLAQLYLSDNIFISQISKTYIWFFRSLPLLILLIFIYNLPQILPSSSVVLRNPFITGLIALVLSESAYIAEIHRGALQAIPKGQYEAAKALGFRFLGLQKHIIIPQALKIALPTLANQYVTIIKMTSLVSVISLTEILLVGQQLYTRNFLVIETLIAVAFFYILIITIVTYLLKKVENKLDVSKYGESSKIEEIHFTENKLPKLLENKEESYKTEFALEIIKAQKNFGSTQVLKNIDLSIKWGEVISIIGPSGSGKTTLIRSINGLETLDKGEIKLEGQSFIYGKHNKNKINRKIYNDNIVNIGMVFQNYNLFPHKNVLENIMLSPLYHKQGTFEEIREKSLSILKKIGLLDHANKYPYQLSGGQQQRVAIARSLVMNPSIVLFDEPTSALDPELVKDVLSVIEELAKEGMTMIIVTHEMKFASKISDRIIFMEKGEIIYNESPKELIKNKHSRLTNYFTEDYDQDYVI